MEESIWLYVGVIASIFALVVISNLVLLNQDQTKEQHAKNSVALLEQKCNFVCGSEKGTYLSEKVALPSGSVLIAEDHGICISYNEKTSCGRCDCQIEPYDLNLNTQAHIEAFTVSDFYCAFLKTETGVSVECKG